MKALDDRAFLAMLAHDIRGPLTSISGFAELLEEGLLEGDEATDAAKTIRTNAQRLAAMAGDLELLSRVGSETPLAEDTVDVSAILHELIAETIDGERSIVAEITAECALVRGDATLLRDAFDALLRNAMKYAPKRERIHVTLVDDGAAYAIGIDHTAARGIGFLLASAILARHGGGLEVTNGRAVTSLPRYAAD
jgi:two-component system, OmpR family, phosphate regulon sensor histidine kinase PhoR